MLSLTWWANPFIQTPLYNISSRLIYLALILHLMSFIVFLIFCILFIFYYFLYYVLLIMFWDIFCLVNWNISSPLLLKIWKKTSKSIYIYIFTSFRFTTKLSVKHLEFLHIPSLYICSVFSAIDALQHDGTFLTINETSLTHHYHPKSLGLILGDTHSLDFDSCLTTVRCYSDRNNLPNYEKA